MMKLIIHGKGTFQNASMRSLIYKLGQIPKVGDRIEIENMLLAVTAADKRKVKKIGITVKT